MNKLLSRLCHAKVKLIIIMKKWVLITRAFIEDKIGNNLKKKDWVLSIEKRHLLLYVILNRSEGRERKRLRGKQTSRWVWKEKTERWSRLWNNWQPSVNFLNFEFLWMNFIVKKKIYEWNFEVNFLCCPSK